ncbi:hypothetical protein [Pilimelia columellifera]|uniref:Uncharacterized protein n=1 Tax=Pilimelia columellifera subsp. columellifera TaxID=706583 RepID=A0ABP6AT91_9ACTN
MTESTIPEVGGGLAARQARIRELQLLFALHRYGPGYQQVTGNGLRYVGEIVKATPQEAAWLAAHVQQHPEVWQTPYRTDGQWDAERRDRGELAFTASDTAYRAGRHARSMELLDEAYAYGVIGDTTWRALSDLITKATAPPSGQTPDGDTDSGAQVSS